MSLKGFKSRVRNKIAVLQHKCSLLAAFFQLLTGNFLIINNTAEDHEFSPPLISKPEVRHNPELVLTMYDLKPS